jgi:hypothetical protein
MQNINNLINQNMPHITTNTVILIVFAIIAFYILLKVASSLIKIAACVAVCWFLLMSVQSTSIANIPVVEQAYITMDRVIPTAELWREASSYVNYTKRISKAINDLISST